MESKEKLQQRITEEYEEYKKWDVIVERSSGIDGNAIRQRNLYEGFMNRALERYAVLDLTNIPVAEKPEPIGVVLGEN